MLEVVRSYLSGYEVASLSKGDLVTEEKNFMPGTDRFNVIDSNKKEAFAARIDRTSGQRWIMY